MSDNGNNNNKKAYKKKFYSKKKWHNNNAKDQKDNSDFQEDIEQDFETEDNDIISNNIQEEISDITSDEDISEKSEDFVEEENHVSIAPKFIENREDEEKEDFGKQDDNDDYFIKIDWPLHDSMKKELTPDFHRGCRIKAENYSVGSNVLRHNQCKLDSFNWLKDYQEVPYEGELLVAEVRFKNDRKDFYSYPSELELIEGELVAVETAIGHDIGIVTMVGT